MKTEALEKRLGLTLAARRKSLGWTQEFVAQHISVETETISRIERGVTVPSLKTLEKLAELLSVKLGDLFSGNVEVKSPSDIESLALVLDRLHPDDRHYIMESIGSLVKHLSHVRKTSA